MACASCNKTAASGGGLNYPNMSYTVQLVHFGVAEFAPFMGGRYTFSGRGAVEVQVSHAAQLLGYRAAAPEFDADPLRVQHLFQLAVLSDFERMAADGFMPAGATADEYVMPGAPAAPVAPVSTETVIVTVAAETVTGSTEAAIAAAADIKQAPVRKSRKA